MTGDKQFFRRNTGVETAPLQQESIVFHPQINRFCILNRTSSFIWSRLEAPMSPQQLADDICARFEGVSPSDALSDVHQALAKLVELDLVVTTACE
jgi:hypothetical protein